MNLNQVDHNLDPTVDFLMNRQKLGGNCEFFATALVMMCRANGINARGVAGYLGSGIQQRHGHPGVVRARDAHMWAEVYVPGQGWVLSDPSPSRSLAINESGPLTRWAQDIIQAVQNLWLANVVSFDSDSARGGRVVCESGMGV